MGDGNVESGAVGNTEICFPYEILLVRKRILFELREQKEDKERSSKKQRKNIEDHHQPLQLLNLIEPLLLPWRMKEKIDAMGGFEIKLLIQKKLFQTDLSSKHNRFANPIKKISKEFMREEEKEVLETRTSNNKLAGINVKIVDPCLREYESFLKKWAMTSCSVYNLTHKWNAIVKDNRFQCNDTVQLWSFRVPNDKLCFALVKL